LIEFAGRAIDEEQLGDDETPDLLCLGISQTDSIGHAHGPDSQEVFDTFVRLDRQLAGLLRFLDSKVGTGRYLVVLVSDHGVAPLPEHKIATEPATSSARVSGSKIDNLVLGTLTEKFAPAPGGARWFARDNSGIRINRAALEALSVSLEDAAAVTKAALLSNPQIASAYTRAELLGSAELDPIGESVRLAYHPTRSADVIYVPRPFFVERSNAGTTHGTPHRYDTHVPLIFFGEGLKHAVHAESVGMESVAPTIEKLLGIPASSAAPSLF
jgi:predicted AlkP superfamily pyrophosphatase or phosphodiesterase